MRYAAPEDQPEAYSYDPPQPPPKQKPSRVLPWIIGAVVVGLLVLCSGIILTAIGDDATNGVEPISTSTIPTPGAAPTYDSTPPALPKSERAPALADFKLTPKITSKECFGSAGCLIEFKVNLAYNGPVIPDDDEYELTYEVRGVEDGPLIGNIQMEGETYSVPQENAQTSSRDRKITIKVTSVDKLGL